MVSNVLPSIHTFSMHHPMMKFYSLTVLAKKTVWEAEFSCSLVRVSSAIGGKDFVPPCGLGPLCSIVVEPGSHQTPKKVAHRSEKVGQGPEKLGVGRTQQTGRDDDKSQENSHFLICCFWSPNDDWKIFSTNPWRTTHEDLTMSCSSLQPRNTRTSNNRISN